MCFGGEPYLKSLAETSCATRANKQLTATQESLLNVRCIIMRPVEGVRTNDHIIMSERAFSAVCFGVDVTRAYALGRNVGSAWC